METLILQVDCRPYLRNGPPQLGITVEAPYSTPNSTQAITANNINKHDNRSNNRSSQQGLKITKIQPGSIIDLTRQCKVGDIIIEVNGICLERPFSEAQKTLKQFVVENTSHEPLIFKVLRQSVPLTPNSNSQMAVRHLVDTLNSRRIGTRYKLRLRKGPKGFGLKIAERDNMRGTNKPIFITAITTTGSAYQDGQLKEGDMLLEVNGIDLVGKSQLEVTRMLSSIPADELVELTISRQEIPSENQSNDRESQNTTDNQVSLIDLNIPDSKDSVFIDNSDQQMEKKIDSLLFDGPGIYVYDIPLNDSKSAGLGLYLKYPRRASDRKDLGVWIEKVITGGAAWKDGRLQPEDQILAINGINLAGLLNSEAQETLTATVGRGSGPEAAPFKIKLKIQRRDPMVAAKILLGTNNSIEHSDMIADSDRRILTDDETPLDITLQTESTESNLLDNSSALSNRNTKSPQTQASISFKTSSITDGQNTSDKTNETTSSAISQITDYASVPIPALNEYQDIKIFNTTPKILELENPYVPNQTNGHSQSRSQSWDDKTTGEEAFQRDGFGRKSMSEKRHAQMSVKNTDTFKRNQLAREARESQRKLEEQMARDRTADGNDEVKDKPRRFFLPAIDINQYQSEPKIDQSDPTVINTYRECAVDVPVQPSRLDSNNQSGRCLSCGAYESMRSTNSNPKACVTSVPVSAMPLMNQQPQYIVNNAYPQSANAPFNTYQTTSDVHYPVTTSTLRNHNIQSMYTQNDGLKYNRANNLETQSIVTNQTTPVTSQTHNHFVANDVYAGYQSTYAMPRTLTTMPQNFYNAQPNIPHIPQPASTQSANTLYHLSPPVSYQQHSGYSGYDQLNPLMQDYVNKQQNYPGLNILQPQQQHMQQHHSSKPLGVTSDLNVASSANPYNIYIARNQIQSNKSNLYNDVYGYHQTQLSNNGLQHQQHQHQQFGFPLNPQHPVSIAGGYSLLPSQTMDNNEVAGQNARAQSQLHHTSIQRNGVGGSTTKYYNNILPPAHAMNSTELMTSVQTGGAPSQPHTTNHRNGGSSATKYYNNKQLPPHNIDNAELTTTSSHTSAVAARILKPLSILRISRARSRKTQVSNV